MNTKSSENIITVESLLVYVLSCFLNLKVKHLLPIYTHFDEMILRPRNKDASVEDLSLPTGSFASDHFTNDLQHISATVTESWAFPASRETCWAPDPWRSFQRGGKEEVVSLLLSFFIHP